LKNYLEIIFRSHFIGGVTDRETVIFGYGFYVNINEDNPEKNITIRMYPNPVQDIVNVEITMNTVANIFDYDIVSIDGSIVGSGSATSTNFSFSAGNMNLAKGVYYLRIRYNDTMKAVPFLLSE